MAVCSAFVGSSHNILFPLVRLPLHPIGRPGGLCLDERRTPRGPLSRRAGALKMAVEARSLAGLNSLAADPPAYARRPGSPRQKPLTLYISRVPGTHDVILSAHRPLREVVSAEDICCCLYYVHLELRDSSRPPVPPIPASYLSPPPSARQPVHRRPISISMSQAFPPPVPNPGLIAPSTPPTPPHGRFSSPSPTASAMKWQTDLTPTSSRPSVESMERIGPRPQGPGSIAAQSPIADFGQLHPVSSYRPLTINTAKLTTSALKSFSLTLIRRDPSSGQQWNVACILSGQADTVAANHSDTEPTNSTTFSLLQVHIDTPGYTKFVSDQYHSVAVDQRAVPPSPPLSTVDSPGFHRAISATFGNSLSTELRGIFRRPRSWIHSPAPSFETGAVRYFPTHHTRQHSSDWPTNLAGKATAKATAKARVYGFTSPWGGSCRVRSSNGGRAFKCRHELNDEPVSELRLNLPRRSAKGGRGAGQIRGHFSKMLGDGDSSYDEEDDNDDEFSGAGDGFVSPFELNLGREMAGGGNWGQRAKLGKIIIHDEGLNMLDLAVAVNVGLWWTLWAAT